MAAAVSRTFRILKPGYGSCFGQFSRVYTARDLPRSRGTLATFLGVAAGALGAGGLFLYALDRSVRATGHELEAPYYPWDFERLFVSLDHASVRRGWEVYKTICSACHSLKYVRYRELVGVTHTEEEAKSLAEEIQVQDGPDENGEYYMRPGKLSDSVPSPYPNEEAARAANGGAFPADLTYVILARRNGTNYLYSLLTGWMDPPAGIELRDGQSFNVYFPGGTINMGPIIDNDAVTYEDGTKAYQSQIAKDVVSFLTWTSSPEFDTRKVWLIKSLGVFTFLVWVTYHMKRLKFSVVKSRKIAYVPKKKW